MRQRIKLAPEAKGARRIAALLIKGGIKPRIEKRIRPGEIGLKVIKAKPFRNDLWRETLAESYRKQQAREGGRDKE